jgi:hypothetical protein
MNFAICDDEKIYLEELSQILSEYMNHAQISDYSLTAPDFEKDEQEKQTAAARIEELQSKLAVLEEKDKAFLDSYIADKFTLEEYRDVKKLIGNERKEIQTETERLTPKEKSKSLVEPKTKEEIIRYFKRNWRNFSNIEKRQFLLKHITKVKVINHPVPNSIFGNLEIIEIEFNTN